MHEINVLTLVEQASMSMTHTPHALMKYAKMPINFEHYANLMVNPVTGTTISSYKKLLHNPATAKVWQMAFGRDFGRIAQGDNKTGQKGTNAMFLLAFANTTKPLQRRNGLVVLANANKSAVPRVHGWPGKHLFGSI
jgi:hypothetical protein